MDTLLKALYDEYSQLKEKLDKIGATIQTYGGTLPTGDLTTKTSPAAISDGYSATFTWKQKIRYALRSLGQASTVVEIVAFLISKEPNGDRDKLHRAITQLSSSMGVSGDLGVDKSTGVNRYFLK